jgi:hypothetical protein
VGRAPSVLPRDIRPQADRWLLKMHGCVAHPEDIVLTREDYLGYDRRRQALAGIVQALLITRHMLFVGFSLNDDNFHRIADAVRRAVRPAGAEAGEPFGTAVTLVRKAMVEPLWKGDLQWASMIDPANRLGSDEKTREHWPAEAARLLEIFLDYLLARTRDTAHLLNDHYQTVLTGGEKELRTALLDLRGRLPHEARETAAWARIETLLAQMGLGKTSNS